MESKTTNKPLGWIQAVRSDFIPKEWQWVFEDPKAFKLAYELASRARREEGSEWYRGEKVELSPREFIVGRFKTSEKVGLSPSEYRKLYRKFEKDNLITTIRATRRYSVGKWLGDGLFYINPIDEKPSVLPSEAPTHDHQPTIKPATNKEDKESKNNEKEASSAEQLKRIEKTKTKIRDKFGWLKRESVHD